MSKPSGGNATKDKPGNDGPFLQQVAALNDNDKNRLICTLKHAGALSNIDWKAAAEDFGSASAGSFQKMYQVAMKKLTGEAVTTPRKTKPEGKEKSTTTTSKKRKSPVKKELSPEKRLKTEDEDDDDAKAA